jgi:uncharacterized membrane protein YidH (DUF202 family)
MFKKFWDFIKKSCEKDSGVSSTRTTSYIILAMIVMFCLYFMGVGIYMVVSSKVTPIPSELLIVFGALLTHQLTLLGINKYNETKQIISNKPADSVPTVEPTEITK